MSMFVWVDEHGSLCWWVLGDDQRSYLGKRQQQLLFWASATSLLFIRTCYSLTTCAKELTRPVTEWVIILRSRNIQLHCSWVRVLGDQWIFMLKWQKQNCQMICFSFFFIHWKQQRKPCQFCKLQFPPATQDWLFDGVGPLLWPPSLLN